MQAQSAAANAIMFDRSSGIGCNECLERCSKKFQNHSTKWICRSLTYDHRWKICDLFAVNGGDSPYNLLDFEGRDYFQYMPAFPPTDFEMLGIKQNENNEILEYNNNLTNNNLQCNCPCKAFSELINQKNIPLILNNKTENEEKSDEATNIVSTSEINSTINSTLDNFNSEQLFGTKNIEIGQSLENQFINLTTLSLPINLEQKQLNNQNNSFNNFLENNSSLIQSELFSIISPKNSSLEEKLEIGKSFGSKIFEPQKDVELIEKPFLKQQKIINNSCPKIGQIAYYAEIEGKIEGKKNEKTEKINEIKNSRDCLNICDGKTKTINFCNSAQWTSTEGCELFSNFSTQILSQKLTFLPSNETENAKYFEKVCIDKNILKDENRKTFIAIPGYILVG
uniref:Apple domain-containing protein n=1 Tax=Meloidogyne hapla TaxID=6305 RepID=A0A1I8BG52_MELHA